MRALSKIIARVFAPYWVLDDHGTAIPCWTLDSASKWISYCGYRCYVVNTYTGEIVIERYQVRI